MQGDCTIERLSQAARPTLLDAAARPELLIALLFANLMSPSLWELKRKIHQRVGKGSHDTEVPFAERIMREIHKYVNKKFHHVSHLDVAAIWGLLDLEEERARLGTDAVDYAMDIILRAVADRRGRGVLTPKQDLFLLADMGKFPEYEYSTIDIIEAHSRNMGKKHRPLGISSCADEAALMAALACVESGLSLDDVAILGSPAHYTTLVAHKDKSFWFNGKQEYFDSDEWKTLVAHGGKDEIQDAFDLRIGVFDRTITPLGFHLLDTGECTMTGGHARHVYESFNEFFRVELSQISQARDNGFEMEGVCSPDAFMIDMAAARDALHVQKMVRRMAAQFPESAYESALYTFRSIDVERPEAYVEVALRGYRARLKAAQVRDLAHAVDVVRRIPGDESIFHTTDRVALPDEVLLFNTGSHRDKALLLYSLIHHSPKIEAEQKQGMEVVFTEGTSYVRVGGRCVNTSTFADEPDVPDAVLRVRRAHG